MDATTALAVVVEPPVSVANTLLETVRRLAADFEERGAECSWAPPHQYAAALALAADPPAEVFDAAGDRLRALLQGVEECPVQLEPPALEIAEGRDDLALLHCALRAGEAELARVVAAAMATLSGLGMEAEVASRVRVPLAVVRGAASVAAVSDLLKDPKDVPVAGWLLGGVCLSICTRSRDGFWLPGERRFVGLRRMGRR